MIYNMNSVPSNFDDFLKGPAVILGLSRHRTTRYDYTLQKLQDAGFTSLSYFEGTDGFNDDIVSISNELNIRLRDTMMADYKSNIPENRSDGSLGFTLSCIRIWKKVVDEGLPFLIIFEDDALPEANFKNIARQWYDETPKTFDFMFMGSGWHDHEENKAYYGQRIISYPCFCTHAYVITNEGAKKALRLANITSQKNGVDKGDCEMIVWMRQNNINYYVWNNRGVHMISYPTADKHTDSVIKARDNGLIYQNYKLGTTIHTPEILIDDRYI